MNGFDVSGSKCDKLAAPLNGELKCSRQEKTIVCIIDCNKGHSFYVASINSSSSLHIYGENVALCDLDTGLWTVAHRPIHSADLQCKRNRIHQSLSIFLFFSPSSLFISMQNISVSIRFQSLLILCPCHGTCEVDLKLN